MKKFFFSILVFLVSIFSFSQDLLFKDTWILEFISIENENYPNANEYPVTDDNGNRILLNINQSPTSNFNSTICGLIEIQYSEDLEAFNKFTILSTNATLAPCSKLGDQDFENLYFGFFQPSTTYSYSIGCLLGGSACFLTIYAPNGDEAHYWNGELSNNSNDKLTFSIYPNPVKNLLNITVDNSSNHLIVKILDVHGKVIIRKNQFNRQPIHIENLSQGLYFLSITDELGHTSVKKFIK